MILSAMETKKELLRSRCPARGNDGYEVLRQGQARKRMVRLRNP